MLLVGGSCPENWNGWSWVQEGNSLRSWQGCWISQFANHLGLACRVLVRLPLLLRRSALSIQTWIQTSILISRLSSLPLAESRSSSVSLGSFTTLLMATIWHLLIPCLWVSGEYAFLNNQGVAGLSFTHADRRFNLYSSLLFSRQGIATCRCYSFQKWGKPRASAEPLSKRSKDAFEQFCVFSKMRSLILRSG